MLTASGYTCCMDKKIVQACSCLLMLLSGCNHRAHARRRLLMLLHFKIALAKVIFQVSLIAGHCLWLSAESALS